MGRRVLLPSPSRQTPSTTSSERRFRIRAIPRTIEGASSFPISGYTDTVSTSAGGQISASRTSDVLATDIFPSLHEEPSKVRMRIPVSMAVPIDMNRHQANNAGVVVPFDLQDLNSQALNGPRPAFPPEPAPQPRLGRGQAILPPNDRLTASSIPSRAPQAKVQVPMPRTM